MMNAGRVHSNRRRIVIGATAAAAGLMAGTLTLGVGMGQTFAQVPEERLKVVVFGGHPDDPESGAGGLIAALTKAGHEVICAYGTAFRGDRKFFGRPESEVRRAEAVAACEVLGATPHFFDYAHEKLEADKRTLQEVSKWLNETQPDVPPLFSPTKSL